MKYFNIWKKRYQDLYRRHEKLAVIMTLNLSMAQEQIDNHVEQGKALLLANEDLMNQVQQLSEKVESLEISLGLQKEYAGLLEESNQTLADQARCAREDITRNSERAEHDLAEALEKLDICRKDFRHQIKVADYYRHLSASYELAQELGYTR